MPLLPSTALVPANVAAFSLPLTFTTLFSARLTLASAVVAAAVLWPLPSVLLLVAVLAGAVLLLDDVLVLLALTLVAAPVWLAGPNTWNSHSEYPYCVPRAVPYMRT